jgi:hypothetical protein
VRSATVAAAGPPSAFTQPQRAQNVAAGVPRRAWLCHARNKEQPHLPRRPGRGQGHVCEPGGQEAVDPRHLDGRHHPRRDQGGLRAGQGGPQVHGHGQAGAGRGRHCDGQGAPEAARRAEGLHLGAWAAGGHDARVRLGLAGPPWRGSRAHAASLRPPPPPPLLAAPLALQDGFPRTTQQAKELDSFQTVGRVVNITLPEHVLMAKMLARRTCADCGRGYNLANIKEGACAHAQRRRGGSWWWRRGLACG